ncbi:MAG: penicillin-binding protein activator LpoB [Deltaproteobacteria bacterium]|nr:penicillin-binding protein activator LpoB [Deltaproteobacteria bacterium]
MKLVQVVCLTGVGLSFAGCARQVSYQDPTRVETVTEEWGSSDIQTVADRMANSMVRLPEIANNSRPIVQVSTLKNKTTEHIDTKSITDKIRTALIKTGMVRFTAVSDAAAEIGENIDYQQGGAVNKATAKKSGKQVGADYLLYGEVDSIVKQAGRTTDVYYKLTLNLANVETGIIEWSDEKEIRKQAERPLLGY